MSLAKRKLKDMFISVYGGQKVGTHEEIHPCDWSLRLVPGKFEFVGPVPGTRGMNRFAVELF